MKDMNNKEIKTGDIVEIKNAYFKGDNGLWLVENTPDDPNWLGKQIGLRKICKNGKIVEKKSVGFWPIMVTVSGYEKKATAKAWNEENATIEITTVKNIEPAREYFKAEADGFRTRAEWLTINGFAPEVIEEAETLANYYDKVAARM